jgi:amidohydrolase
MIGIDVLRKKASEQLAEVVAIRRHLHAHPELSFEEEQTARFVSGQLREMGIPHRTGVAGHGVVALIEGLDPGRNCVCLRGDMDALPIQEANDVPYRSTRQGVMHACGHDVHTASLLGAARLLWETRTEWYGTVKLLFQPAEEKLPGGASLMIEAGALQNPSPTAIFGQHVHPSMRAGKVGFRAGPYMASADELYVTVRGKGGHGALPHETVDPVLVASHLVVALQQLVSRMADPLMPTVLSFGRFLAEGATNVVPNEVRLEGTFRTMDEKWRAEAHRRMVQLATGLCVGMGASCDFHIAKGYPALLNHEGLTRRARQWAVDYLGPENVEDLPLRMTAEDFAYYSQVMPACFYRLGTGNPEKGLSYPVHTDRFDIDESALETGAGLMAWMAVCSAQGNR